METGDPIQDEEDLRRGGGGGVHRAARRARARAGRLLAHARPCCARRTAARPPACRMASGRSGLLHLGPRRQDKEPPERLGARRLRNVPAVIPRADALASLERDSFDLVVVGGGITGAGVALDAASRGYSVALVEKSDFAAGTSSRSSKLVHGGLRYLQNFDLGLVREALLERSLLVKLAPHLVRPLPFVVPDVRGQAPRPHARHGAQHVRRHVVAPRPRPRRGGGVEPGAPPHDRRRRGARAACRRSPAREPTAGYLFYDCQTDDVRLVLTVLGEAERFGAVIANRCEVTGPRRARRPRRGRARARRHRRRRVRGVRRPTS